MFSMWLIRSSCHCLLIKKIFLPSVLHIFTSLSALSVSCGSRCKKFLSTDWLKGIAFPTWFQTAPVVDVVCGRFVSRWMLCWTSWMICLFACELTRPTSTWNACWRRTLVSTCWWWSSSQRQWKSVTGNGCSGSCACRGCCPTWRSVSCGTWTSSRTRWSSRMCCSSRREKWRSKNSSNKYNALASVFTWLMQCASLSYLLIISSIEPSIFC